MYTAHRRKSLIAALTAAILLLACLACGSGETVSGPSAPVASATLAPPASATSAPPASATSAPPASATPAPPASATSAPPASATPPPPASTQPPSSGAAPTLVLDRTTFQPGEELTVRFTAPATYPTDAWVGLIPASVPHGSVDVNDENDLDYEYLDGRASGVMVFTAPVSPGAYDLRMNNTEDGGQEVASVTFTVVASAGGITPTLVLDRTTFQPGEEIQVRFTAPATYPIGAWVGIVPADVPHGSGDVNDENDLAYEYLDGRGSGVMVFTAPVSPGAYDLRMNDADDGGQEVASVGFTVVAPAGETVPTLVLDRTTFLPGEGIQVRFTAPATYPTDAWVGLLPASVPHGSVDVNDENDLDYEYLDGRISGVMTFTAPDTPGAYDLRMNDTEDGGQEVTFVAFSVALPTGEIVPTLVLDKTTFQPGEEIQVRFTAPATYPTDAWVGLLPASVPHGSGDVNDENELAYEYLEGRVAGVMIFTAPDTPGAYDLRMNDADDGGKEVASVAFTVE
jgi:hypothetical protein